MGCAALRRFAVGCSSACRLPASLSCMSLALPRQVVNDELKMGKGKVRLWQPNASSRCPANRCQLCLLRECITVVAAFPPADRGAVRARGGGCRGAAARAAADGGAGALGALRPAQGLPARLLHPGGALLEGLLAPACWPGTSALASGRICWQLAAVIRWPLHHEPSAAGAAAAGGGSSGPGPAHLRGAGCR